MESNCTNREAGTTDERCLDLRLNFVLHKSLAWHWRKRLRPGATLGGFVHATATMGPGGQRRWSSGPRWSRATAAGDGGRRRGSGGGGRRGRGRRTRTRRRRRYGWQCVKCRRSDNFSATPAPHRTTQYSLRWGLDPGRAQHERKQEQRGATISQVCDAEKVEEVEL